VAARRRTAGGGQQDGRLIEDVLHAREKAKDALGARIHAHTSTELTGA